LARAGRKAPEVRVCTASPHPAEVLVLDAHAALAIEKNIVLRSR